MSIYLSCSHVALCIVIVKMLQRGCAAERNWREDACGSRRGHPQLHPLFWVVGMSPD
jgi:hypothetical protein